MESNAEAYTGTDNLEVMEEAVNYNRFLIRLVENKASKSEAIYDFGAGIGTFAAELIADGYPVHCIEPDAAQFARLQEAKMRASRNLADLPDDSADLIYTLNVLEHIEGDRAALAELFRKIKPGGRLLIYVPAFMVIYSSMDRKVGHHRRYTRRELAEKVQGAGFRIRKNQYVDSLGFLASLAYKWIGNDKGDVNRSALIFYDRFVFPLSRAGDLVFGKLFGKNVFLLAEKP